MTKRSLGLDIKHSWALLQGRTCSGDTGKHRNTDMEQDTTQVSGTACPTAPLSPYISHLYGQARASKPTYICVLYSKLKMFHPGLTGVTLNDLPWDVGDDQSWLARLQLTDTHPSLPAASQGETPPAEGQMEVTGMFPVGFSLPGHLLRAANTYRSPVLPSQGSCAGKTGWSSDQLEIKRSEQLKAFHSHSSGKQREKDEIASDSQSPAPSVCREEPESDRERTEQSRTWWFRRAGTAL